MTELEQKIFIGTICTIVGGMIGYYIGIKKAKRDPKFTPLQLLAVLIFAGYVAFAEDPSDVVAVAILTLIGGEIIGSKIAEKAKELKK